MTTEKKSETTTAPTVNDNKAVFGPLGKYAVVAVIMASIIVTTAIMLDKQLNTVDEQIAAMESEVAQMHTTDSVTNDVATSDKPVEIITTTAEANSTKLIKETEVTAQAEATPAPAPVATQIAETPTAEVLVAMESTPVTDQASEQTTIVETVETATPVQTNQTQLAMDNQARIEAYKLEQKQRMAEMFARIRSLESKQLDQYKISQDGQIARLRNQLTSQQQMIDKLVLRNKELFEMRAASVKRNQTNREQVLNRI